MILQPLTSSEEEIMKLVWEKESIYFRELMEIFPEPKPHQNTVSTFLKILVEKSYLKTEKQGRIYLYRPAVEFGEYRKFVLKRFLENYFNSSISNLFKTLLELEYIHMSDFVKMLDEKVAKLSMKNNIESENPIQDYIKEITYDKKPKKKDKKKKKKKK